MEKQERNIPWPQLSTLQYVIEAPRAQIRQRLAVSNTASREVTVAGPSSRFPPHSKVGKLELWAGKVLFKLWPEPKRNALKIHSVFSNDHQQALNFFDG